jgi:hypothetical protein
VIEDSCKENDWILTENGVEQAPEPKDKSLVVIASSNLGYGLPKFSKKFLEKYEEKQGINEVFVVYEETHKVNDNGIVANVLIPKTNKYNVISLRKTKETFNTKEIHTLFKEFREALCPKLPIDDLNKWLSNV